MSEPQCPAVWPSAFVAMSVAMGVTRDDACGMLGEDDAGGARRLVRALSAPTRVERARAIAAALAEVMHDVAAMEVR